MTVLVLSGIMCVGFIMLAGAGKLSESLPFENRKAYSNKTDKIEQEIQRTRDKVLYWSFPCH